MIGAQHGAEAVRVRGNAIDPNRAAWNKFFGEPGKDYGDGAGPVEGAVRKLIDGHNEYEARIAALEDAVRRGPFG